MRSAALSPDGCWWFSRKAEGFPLRLLPVCQGILLCHSESFPNQVSSCRSSTGKSDSPKCSLQPLGGDRNPWHRGCHEPLGRHCPKSQQDVRTQSHCPILLPSKPAPHPEAPVGEHRNTSLRVHLFPRATPSPWYSHPGKLKVKLLLKGSNIFR